MKVGKKNYNVGKYILDLPNVKVKEEIFDYIKRCRKFNG